jgi:hypothetical protein
MNMHRRTDATELSPTVSLIQLPAALDDFLVFCIDSSPSMAASIESTGEAIRVSFKSSHAPTITGDTCTTDPPRLFVVPSPVPLLCLPPHLSKGKKNQQKKFLTQICHLSLIHIDDTALFFGYHTQWMKRGMHLR